VKMAKYMVEEIVEIPDTLEGFKKWEFSSGSTTGKDYLIFHRLLIQSIKRSLPRGAKLVNTIKGHYFTSGFIERDGKFIYKCWCPIKVCLKDYYAWCARHGLKDLIKKNERR